MGSILGSFELVEVVGRGSTGSVWRARHREHGTWVAVKVLHDDLADEPEVRQRFVKEAAVLADRVLPGVVPVLGTVTEADNRLAVVMELVDGPNLRQWLAQHGPLAPADACLLIAQVATGVAAAHAAGIVHRDLKPENVLVTRRDGRRVALVSDFGLARLVEGQTLTRSSRVVGTPDYLAPELLHGGRPTAAVDVYALGVMLFELLTGWRPFRGPSVAVVLHQHLHARLERPEGVPDLLWDLIEQSLSRNTGSRPSSGQLADALVATAPAVQGLPARERTTPPPPAADELFEEAATHMRISPPSPRRAEQTGWRRRLGAALPLTVLLVLVLVLAAALTQALPKDPHDDATQLALAGGAGGGVGVAAANGSGRAALPDDPDRGGSAEPDEAASGSGADGAFPAGTGPVAPAPDEQSTIGDLGAHAAPPRLEHVGVPAPRAPDDIPVEAASTARAAPRGTSPEAPGEEQQQPGATPDRPPTVAASGLGDATVGRAYRGVLQAGGGRPPYQWALVSGRLPAGLVLSGDGSVTGTPTEPLSVNFSVRVLDAAGLTATAQKSLTTLVLVGDLTRDGEVDCADYADLQAAWDWGAGSRSGHRADLNGDGSVDARDLSIMLSHWTGSATTCAG